MAKQALNSFNDEQFQSAQADLRSILSDVALNPNSCSAYNFSTTLRHVLKHDHCLLWSSLIHPERIQHVQDSLYKKAKNEVCIYTESLDHIPLTALDRPLAYTLKLNIICNQKPDEQSSAYQALNHHIARSKKGFIVTASETSRAIISNVFEDGDAQPFTLFDRQDYMIGTQKDNTEMYVRLGYNKFDPRPAYLTEHFFSAAAQGIPVVGQKPKSKRSILAQIFD